MVQIWESVSAIQAALGDDWDQPITLPEEARGIVDSASVEHYDVADTFIASADVAERVPPG